MNEPEVDFSFVVAVLNEEANVVELIHRLRGLETALGDRLEFILVDDGSTDRTWEILTQLHKNDPRVRGLRFSRNFGQHVAISAGLAHARGRYVVIMDGDLQEPPEMVPVLYETLLRERREVVIGLRRGHQEGKRREWLSDLYGACFNYLARQKIPPNATNMRILTRKVVDILNSCPEKNKFVGGLLSWTGYPPGFVTIDMQPRRAGRTHYNLRKLLAHGLNGIFSFSVFPLRLVIMLGTLFSLGGFAMALLLVVYKLLEPAVPMGYTSLIVSVIFFGGVILLCLGIVGEYVGRIHDHVKQRPDYIIDTEL